MDMARSGSATELIGGDLSQDRRHRAAADIFYSSPGFLHASPEDRDHRIGSLILTVASSGDQRGSA
jgi:hypothetical protein